MTFNVGLSIDRSGAGAAATGPSAPTGFALTGRTAESLSFEWDALPGGVTARIMWVQHTGDWDDFIANDYDLTGGSYTVANLSPNISYDVRIRAETNGLASDWVTLTDIFTYPSAPSNFAAATSVYGAVNLSWDFQVGVTWKLYRDGSEVYSGEVTPHVDYPGSPNQVFGYALKAIGAISGLECALTDTVYGSSGAGSAPLNESAPSASILGTGFATTGGTWTGDPVPGLLYQWQIDPSAGGGAPYWVNVEGANDPELPSATIGYYYRCRVTGTNALGEATAFSNLVMIDPA